MNQFRSFDFAAATAPYAMRNALAAPQGQQNAGGNAFAAGPGMGAGGFRDSLARTESGGRYDVVNDYGYTGKYQFGQDRLDDFNRAAGASVTTTDLVRNPQLQEQIFDWHLADIDNFIRSNGLDRSGMSLDAMRAIAHLGGKGGLLKYVQSGGQYNPSDAYGTSLASYARTHG